MNDYHRQLFEQWTKKHPAEWSLKSLHVNGVFHHYIDPETDSAWLGFQAALAEWDRLLRASVPDRWKKTTSAVGAVQAYIAELELQLGLIDDGDVF